ncbi:unnamed protein product, partial [Hydatigera taeniaeformis]|uniref:ANF_receptor domain-containing protein n=1 Tax=Hydatigena taeniaeformis TaxID=6205 RepID=A0A0R3WYI9_HYDTA
MMNEWMNIGDPNVQQRAQLYQISCCCQVLGSTSLFVNYFPNTDRDSLAPPISAVSIMVQRKTILQGVLVYLISKGWKRIATFYDIYTTIPDIPETLNSILSTLHLSQNSYSALRLLTS